MAPHIHTKSILQIKLSFSTSSFLSLSLFCHFSEKNRWDPVAAKFNPQPHGLIHDELDHRTTVSCFISILRFLVHFTKGNWNTMEKLHTKGFFFNKKFHLFSNLHFILTKKRFSIFSSNLDEKSILGKLGWVGSYL